MDPEIKALFEKYGITSRKVLLALAAVFALRSLIKFQRLVSWRRHLDENYPMLPSSLFLGNIMDLVRAGGFAEEFFFRLHRAKGPFAGFMLGPTVLNFSITDPDMISEVYSKCKSRPLETYLFLWYLGKENLLFSHGEDAKQMRLRYGKMISAREALEKVHQKAYNECTKMVERLPMGQGFPLFKELGPLIYDIMGETLFDTPWLSTERGQEIYRLHKYLIENVNRWMFYPVGPIWHPGFLKYLWTLHKWRSLCNSLLDEREKQIASNPEKYKNGALTLLLTSVDEKTGKKFFSRERAISTVCGFLNGAYDTTHSTTFWLFYFLAKYPEMQDKVYQEFVQVCGSPDSMPNLDKIRDCEYLNAFFMESMRMRATVPVNQRVNLEEDVEIGGYTVPKGTNINIAIGVQMQEEKYFGAKPKEFRPERFLGNTPEADRARRSWAPFGQHARMCIGFTFAQVELKCLVYSVLSKRIVKLEDPQDPGEFMLEAGVNQPSKKFNFVFEKRVDNHKMMEESNLRWWIQQDVEFQKAVAGAKTSSTGMAA